MKSSIIKKTNAAIWKWESRHRRLRGLGGFAVSQAARLGFPLVLAGHTLGGQLALPSPSGSINLARVMTRFTRGLYQLDDTQMYVSRGIGVAGPAVRFNCRRELATLELGV